MVFVQCECNAIHPSTNPVCPGCGRCPRCGQLRVTRQQFADASTCPDCQIPYCAGCGRCHLCGKIRFADWEHCSCGFPTDPEKLATVEKYCNLEAFAEARKGLLGCLSVLLLTFGALLVFLIAVRGAGL